MTKKFRKMFVMMLLFILLTSTKVQALTTMNEQLLLEKLNIVPQENLVNEFDSYNIDNEDRFTVPSGNNFYNSYEYVIDKYHVDIVVNENNTFNIKETITAYFNVAKHGIFRTIPLTNNIKRLDGTVSKNRVQISNLTVNNKYTTSRRNGKYKIKIGSADKELTGEQTYLIQYTYNIGKDPLKNSDEFYYNIIGTDWDTVIGNVTFTITMPKEFDSSKLGFSSGTFGSTNNSNIEYIVDENTISGSYNGILEAGEALTIRCELPEGYFIGAGFSKNYLSYFLFLIPLLFLGISIWLWYKFGRDDPVVETVEFYPPEGFNSLEVGFLYNGKAENRDVISLLIYLANKGYIKISEIEEKTLSKQSETFKIIKLKEYDGNNINEQIFLNGLFSKKESFSRSSETTENFSEVTTKDLYNKFYQTMNKILKNINTKENKNKILEKSASRKKGIILFMIIVSYCVITTLPIFISGKDTALIAALAFPGVGYMVIFEVLFGDKGTNSSIGTMLLGLLLGGLISGIPWFFLVLPSLLQDIMYLIGYIIGIICIFGMAVCLKYLPKRTPYGNQILGKLRGFKNFLEIAEKDQLETMVMQDPSYFYDILPFTYVLGVSDKWIEKFERITLQAPSWYDSSREFHVATFETFLNSTMSSVASAMSSSPSTSSGSSGGGSSGGGSGGGGGGSW